MPTSGNDPDPGTGPPHPHGRPIEKTEEKQTGAIEAAPGIGSEGNVTATTDSNPVAGAIEPTVADTDPPAPQTPTPETHDGPISGSDGFVNLDDMEDPQSVDGQVQKVLHAGNSPLSPVTPSYELIDAPESADERWQLGADEAQTYDPPNEPCPKNKGTETQESDETPTNSPMALRAVGWAIASRLIAGQYVITYEGLTNGNKRFTAYWVCHTEDYGPEAPLKPLPFTYGSLTEFHLDCTRNTDPVLGDIGCYISPDYDFTPLNSEEIEAFPAQHGPQHPYHYGTFKSYWYNGKKVSCFVLRPDLVVKVDTDSLHRKGCVRPIQGLRYRFRLAQGEHVTSLPLVCSLEIDPGLLNDRLVLSQQWHHTWQEYHPHARTLVVGELFMGDVPQTAISHFLRCDPKEIKAAHLLGVAHDHAKWVINTATQEWERSGHGKGE